LFLAFPAYNLLKPKSRGHPGYLLPSEVRHTEGLHVDSPADRLGRTTALGAQN